MEADETAKMLPSLRIGLCLSGGGFRATFFHLGVIRFLRDAGLLKNISHISSVSGGSILAAHVCQNWRSYTGDDSAFQNATDELIAFAQRDIRGRIVRRWAIQWPVVWLSFLLKRWSRTSLLQFYFARLYKGETLKGLSSPEEAHVPELSLLTTSMTTGNLCWFTKNGFFRADRNGIKTFQNGMLPISLAVAASAAFPPLFPPVILSRTDLDVSAEDFPHEFEYLTDGGVYDNLGIRQLHRLVEEMGAQFDSVFISDSSAAFEWNVGKSFGFITSRTVRATDILMNRVGLLEEEGIRVRTKRGDGQYITLSIHDTVSPEIYPLAIDSDLQRKIGKVRTDLDYFSSQEIRMLVQHGYEVAFQGIGKATNLPNTKLLDASNMVWDPFPAKPKESLGQYAKHLEYSRVRRWGLWRWTDYASWVLVVIAISPLALVSWLTYQNMAKTTTIQVQEIALIEKQQTDTKLTPTGFVRSRPQEAEKLIIFVHGLFGDARTWLNDESGAYWPELLKNDEAFNSFDIYSASYPTEISAFTGLDKGLDVVKTDLIERGLLTTYKEIFFIGHSSGGLLSQKIMIDLNSSNQASAVNRVKGILILAPLEHISLMGAESPIFLPVLSAFQTILNKISYLTGGLLDDIKLPVGLSRVNSYITSVGDNWNRLDLPVKTFCAVPTQPIAGFMIMDPIQIGLGQCDESPAFLPTDRIQIAKPRGTEDITYVWAKNKILQ